MKQTPEQQWSVLSALYEEADALPPHALPAWLDRLQAAGHPLLPQLRRMLEARAEMDGAEFLGTLPRLPAREPEPASAWAPGRRVGPYRLVGPLGAGGMAEVWLAERDDGLLKRRVAIKLPHPRPGRESFAVRFERERDILASLRHPHIAALFDAGVTHEGQPWLALEYVEGEPISDYCDRRRLALRERVHLFRQVLLAVQHAHANLVIHRDLKPANILVTPHGEVRLLDFGIAKLLEAGSGAVAETELTRQAGPPMTLRYASPEQIAGLPLTIACDVYSLGVVFYELLCGQPPYERTGSAAQLERAILKIDPRVPSRRPLTAEAAQARGTTPKALCRQLHPELDAIALRCLAKKPASRYSSVDALLADVDRWLAGEAVLARAPGRWYRFMKFASRYRVAMGAAAAAVLSLVGVTTVAVVLGMQAREESARAVAARDFLLDLFMKADPEKAQGRPFTARDMLQAGRRDVLARLSGQPTLQVELLHGIATIQRDMGEYAHADDTYGDVVRLYEQLGRTADAAAARLAQAEIALQLGDTRRAERLLDGAAERVAAAGDARLRAQLRQVEGMIALARNDAARARELFTESRRAALAVHGPRHARSVEALRALIVAEQRLLRFDAALALSDDLQAAAGQVPSLAARERAAIDGDRAELLHQAGRYADALAQADAALPRCLAVSGPHDAVCRRLALGRAHTLVRLGLHERLASERAALEAMAAERASPSLQLEAAQVLLRLDGHAGAVAPPPAALELVRTVGESGPEVRLPALRKARALLAGAEALLAAGDAVAARRWAERARERLQRDDDASVAGALARAEAASVIGIARLQSGDVAAGLQDLQGAQRDLVQLLGEAHPTAQAAALNVAVALQRSTRADEAQALARRAEPLLRRALGPGAPAYGRVRRLVEQLGRPAAHDGGPVEYFL